MVTRTPLDVSFTFIGYLVKMLTGIILPVEGSCFIYCNPHTNENIRWKFWNDTNKETNCYKITATGCTHIYKCAQQTE